MKYRNHFFSVMGLGLYFVFLVYSIPVKAQISGAVRADVTGDGIVDGRDALKTLRHIRGHERMDEQKQEIADVFPYPGTEGRHMGDGRLTEEDVRRILDQAVGLISHGELSGDFRDSPPRIIDFEPMYGSVGTEVIIAGENFIAGNPTANIVMIGDTIATVKESSANRLKVIVPHDAGTGILRVVTPGGVAESEGRFRFTVLVKGMVDIGSHLQQEQFYVVNPFGADAIAEDGTFEIPISDEDVTITALATDGDNNNTYLAVTQPPDDPASAFMKIDSQSTAIALLFNHPFNVTTNPDIAAMTIERLENIPEIEALSQAIQLRYPQGADGIRDEVVQLAWVQAVRAYFGSLPAKTSISLKKMQKEFEKEQFHFPSDEILIRRIARKENRLKPFKTMQLKRRSNKSVFSPLQEETGEYVDVKFYRLDGDYIDARSPKWSYGVEPFVGKRDAADPGMSKPNETGYSPLDWIVEFSRLEVEDFPLGINEPFRRLRARVFEQMEYRRHTSLTANQWTAKIDILYTGVEWLLSQMEAMDGYEYDILHFEDRKEGVYVLRSYSGAFYDRSYENSQGEYNDFDILNKIPNGKEMYYTAMGINIALAAIDVWDLYSPDAKRWGRQALRKGVKNVVRKISQVIGDRDQKDISFNEWFNIFMSSLWEFTKAGFTAIPQGVASHLSGTLEKSEEAPGIKIADDLLKKAHGKFRGTIVSVLEVANKYLGILDKASSVGRVMERFTGLMGSTLYYVKPWEAVQEDSYAIPQSPIPLVLSKGPTPFESILVVVGNPFDAAIESISPNTSGPGDIVTVHGKGFQTNPDNNWVYFFDRRAKVTKVVSSTEMQVEVPRFTYDWGTTHEIDVSIETSASSRISQAPEPFYYIRTPQIRTVEPAIGFSPRPDNEEGPYEDYRGTAFRVTGYNLFSNQLTVRAKKTDSNIWRSAPEGTIVSGGNQRATVRLPIGLEPGEYHIFFHDQETDEFSNSFLISVPPKPVVTEMNPLVGTEGNYITIKGTNLIDARIRIGDYVLSRKGDHQGVLNFVLPRFDTTGQYSVTVMNPSGSASAGSLTITEGISKPTIPDLEEGYSIAVYSDAKGKVADGKISLDEALAFARGEYNSLMTMDDVNEEYTYVRREKKEATSYDDNGNPITWRTYWEDSDPVRRQLEQEGLSEHETRINIYREYPLAGPVKETSEIIDLDADLSMWEEADFLSDGNLTLKTVGYNASQHSEKIVIYAPQAFQVNDFNVGRDDRVKVMNDVALNMRDANISLQDGCEIEARELILSGNFPMNANGVTVRFATMTGGVFEISERYGNTISGTIEKPANSGVTVQGGGFHDIRIALNGGSGNGVVLNETYENKIGIEADRCGIGALILGGNHNQIVSGKLTGCRNGIVIRNALKSYIWDVQTEQCEDTGILVENCESIEIRDCELSNGVQDGIRLKDSRGISIGGSTCKSNQAYGIHIDGNVTHSEIFSCEILSNNNGIGVYGPNTESIYVYECDYAIEPGSNPEPNWKPLGNLNNALIFGNGTRNCEARDSFLSYAGKNGVLIEGPNSSHHRIIGGDTAYDTAFVANGENGILIRNQSGNHEIALCRFGDNKGNAITIENECNDIKINGNRIGANIKFPNRKDEYWVANEGYGILVRNCVGTIIDTNVIGENKKGGIRLENVDSDREEEYHAQLINNYVGFFMFPWENTAYTTMYHRSAFETESGNGIELINCKKLQVDGNFVYGHEYGIYADGQVLNNQEYTSQEFTFLDPWIRKCRDTGFRIGNTENVEVFHLLTNTNGGEGVLFVDSRHVRVWGDSAITQENGAEGITIQGCNEVVVEGMQVAPNNDNGVFISNSSNVTLKDLYISENNTHGVLVTEQSSDIEMIRLDINDNKGDGVYLHDVSNVVLVGTAPRVGFWVMNNGGHGIHMNQAKNIQVGYQTKGANIPGSGEHGIYIHGEGNENIRIESSIIMQSGAESGVEIESGETVWIGGASTDQGNNFEFQQEGCGLRVTGTEARVVIMNNLFGEPPEWESGDRLYGCGNGIILEEGANQCVIEQNLLNANQEDAIIIRNGAHDNYVFQNTITKNGGNGILVQGNESVRNAISQNTITKNLLKGIALENGNENILPPEITFYTWGMDNIQGISMAPDGSVVEVYADDEDEGEILIGIDHVLNGRFRVTGRAGDSSMYLHATVTDTDMNTSEFGEAYSSSSHEYPFVYTSDAKGNRDICYYNPNRFEHNVLTDHAADDYSPGYFPGGNQILFVTEREGNPDIYLMNNDGSSQSPFLVSEGMDADPASRIGGSKILFTSDRNGNLEIFSADTNGENIEQLTNHDAIDRQPALSPDGREIAWISNRSGTFDLWIMNVDGSDPTRLTNSDGVESNPDWSPDGTQIAFVSRQNGNTDIYQINSDGTDLTRLTQDEAQDTDPSWSHDGEVLYFSSARSGKTQIYSLRGTVSKKVSNDFGNAAEPAVTPHSILTPVDTVLSKSAPHHTVAKRNRVSRVYTEIEEQLLTIGSVSAEPGEQVSVPVFLNSGIHIGNIALDISFDPVYLELSEYQLTGIAEFGMSAQNPNYSPSAAGELRFNWIHADGLPSTEPILTLLFKVSPFTEEEELPIRVTAMQAYRTDLNKIPFITGDGKILLEGVNTDIESWMVY